MGGGGGGGGRDNEWTKGVTYRAYLQPNELRDLADVLSNIMQLQRSTESNSFQLSRGRSRLKRI